MADWLTVSVCEPLAGTLEEGCENDTWAEFVTRLETVESSDVVERREGETV